MRCWVALLSLVATVLAGRPGFAEMPQEVSAYGRFEFVLRGEDCDVNFRHASGKLSPLFSVGDCSGTITLAAERKIGDLTLPSKTTTGDEFHLFSIPTLRGGNADPSSQYWAVVARKDGVWATSDGFQAIEFDGGTLVPGPKSILSLEESPTTTSTGVRYLITFGAIRSVNLPKLPSSVLAKTEKTFVGELLGGFHSTNWRPRLATADDEIQIDEHGSCRMPEIAESVGTVEMRAEVTTWSDGRSEVRCLSLRAPKAVPLAQTYTTRNRLATLRYPKEFAAQHLDEATIMVTRNLPDAGQQESVLVAGVPNPVSNDVKELARLLTLSMQDEIVKKGGSHRLLATRATRCLSGAQGIEVIGIFSFAQGAPYHAHSCYFVRKNRAYVERYTLPARLVATDAKLLERIVRATQFR